MRFLDLTHGGEKRHCLRELADARRRAWRFGFGSGFGAAGFNAAVAFFRGVGCSAAAPRVRVIVASAHLLFK